MQTNTHRTSASLLREIEMMRQGSSPYVIQVRGVFKGRVANKGSSELLGLVMEFMERGSLASLQVTTAERSILQYILVYISPIGFSIIKWK